MWEYLSRVGACHLFREVGTKRAYVLSENEFEELKRLNPGVTRYGGEISLSDEILSGIYFTVNKEFLE